MLPAIFETIPSGNRDLAGEGIPEALFDAIGAALKGATSALGSHAPAHVPVSAYKLDDSTDASAGADFQTKISPWEESCFDSRDEAHKNKRRQQLVVVASCIDKVPQRERERPMEKKNDRESRQRKPTEKQREKAREREREREGEKGRKRKRQGEREKERKREREKERNREREKERERELNRGREGERQTN